MVDGDGASCCRCGWGLPGLPAGDEAQCFVSRVSRSIWLVVSALALRSTRFSLIDLPDFFDIECRGDLSAMARSRVGSLGGSVPEPYAHRQGMSAGPSTYAAYGAGTPECAREPVEDAAGQT